MNHEILIVDDESDIRTAMSGILEDEGYQTRQASNSDEALAEVKKQTPSLVILDIWLQNSKLDGLGILDELNRAYPNLPILMISGHGTIETAVSAIKSGAYDFIEKPFKSDRLILMINRALEAYQLRLENAELRRQVPNDIELIGMSPAIKQVQSVIKRVAPTNSRVLISGPAGAGKETIARQIHDNSIRNSAPFIVVNCATLNPERLDIELFGTEATAEIGSVRKIGTLELAHNGTLFLDEVSDMPLETQGKIVRVLQDQGFRRVGGETELDVDVRVIAATNRDLQREIASGRFREDLFYRLSVVPLDVPPLRERREDIPLLASYFLKKASQSNGVRFRELANDALAALQSYDWPGNVRQLRNVIDWLLIMAPGEIEEPIRSDMLPPEINSVSPDSGSWDNGGEILGMRLREAREVFEREYLLAQVNRFGGNISKTAAFVGMERSALHRKLKLLGVHNVDKTAKQA